MGSKCLADLPGLGLGYSGLHLYVRPLCTSSFFVWELRSNADNDSLICAEGLVPVNGLLGDRIGKHS